MIPFLQHTSLAVIRLTNIKLKEHMLHNIFLYPLCKKYFIAIHIYIFLFSVSVQKRQTSTSTCHGSCFKCLPPLCLHKKTAHMPTLFFIAFFKEQQLVGHFKSFLVTQFKKFVWLPIKKQLWVAHNKQFWDQFDANYEINQVLYGNYGRKFGRYCQ